MKQQFEKSTGLKTIGTGVILSLLFVLQANALIDLKTSIDETSIEQNSSMTLQNNPELIKEMVDKFKGKEFEQAEFSVSDLSNILRSKSKSKSKSDSDSHMEDGRMIQEMGDDYREDRFKFVYGRVWKDKDHNGIRNKNETVMPQIAVTLSDDYGISQGTHYTDSHGSYGFLIPTNGHYHITFKVPSGMTVSPRHVGVNPFRDSDVFSSGKSALFSLSNYSSVKIIDMGVYTKEKCGGYSTNIVHFADEHNDADPSDSNYGNRLLSLNYKTMDPINYIDIQGKTNHHADALGQLSRANYMLLVPKGSFFATVRKIKDSSFVKKIKLPFRPRSGDAFNVKHNLTLLNSRDRPSGVLIDATSLKLVGKAGFDVTCDNPYISASDPSLYSKQEIRQLACDVIDFGGDQVSGHPIWISSKAFAILDRSNRMIEIYKIIPDGEKWDTKRIQTIKTDTSLHQMIARNTKENLVAKGNKIFYGSTESNFKQKKVAGVYKFIRKYNDKLKQSKLTPLSINRYVACPDVRIEDSIRKNKGFYPRPVKPIKPIDPIDPIKPSDPIDPIDPIASPRICMQTIDGYGGHNLYITPDKNYLYAPVGGISTRMIREGDKEFDSGDNRGLLPGGIFVVRTSDMKVIKFIQAGKGAGHVNFSTSKGIAMVTNHKDDFVTAIDYRTHKKIKNVPLTGPEFISINNSGTGYFSLNQSHAAYIGAEGDYYYDYWSNHGVFFRIDLSTLTLDRSSLISTGGIPIQGNYYPHVAHNCDIPVPSTTDGYAELFPKWETWGTMNKGFVSNQKDDEYDNGTYTPLFDKGDASLTPPAPIVNP